MNKLVKKFVTHLGKDSFHDTSLSPNGRWIAFTKRSKKIMPDACAFSTTKTDYANQLWIYDLKTMKKNYWFLIILHVIIQQK